MAFHSAGTILKDGQIACFSFQHDCYQIGVITDESLYSYPFVYSHWPVLFYSPLPGRPLLMTLPLAVSQSPAIAALTMELQVARTKSAA